MGKKVITKYFCDVCRTEFDNQDKLKAIYVPSYQTDSEGRDIVSITNTALELCEDCRKKLVNAVEKHFARVIDYPGGIDIKIAEENKK